MDFDDIRLSDYEKRNQEWVKRCSTASKGICELAGTYRKRDDCWLRSMHSGSFNFSFRLHWDDGGEDWLIRFPLPGKSMFLDEKIYREAALMRYIAQHTRIPVPRVIGYGRAADNPTGLGPFIIMTWIEGKKMSDILRTNDAEEKNDVLNPQLDDATLRHLYGQMADILLELWNLDFDSIGSFSPEGSADRLIDSGPLTLEMNELIRTCGLEDLTSQKPYYSSTDYITSLLELQSTQLEKQRNSVYDSEDCRDKYTCRHLMRAIALNFVSKRDNYGPFKLFCDDLCPGNVLVDDSLQVTGVIDWEFCYSAPPQFAGSIPWWLILQRPPTIINDSGPKAFLDAYLPKAEIFLQALETREKVKNMDSLEDKLSARMRQSIQDRSAWFILASRMVSSVDLIYWDMLDEYCWGPRKSIAERVHKSTTNVDIHADREKFVQLKIQQLQEYYSELGDEIKVDYEEEQYHEPNSSNDQKNMDGADGFSISGAVGFFVLGFTTCLFMKRYLS